MDTLIDDRIQMNHFFSLFILEWKNYQNKVFIRRDLIKHSMRI